MEFASINIANQEQWNVLSQQSNDPIVPEMVLTKKGQLLTPSLQYTVAGINVQTKYTARLILQREADFTYKWNKDLEKFVQQQTIDPEEAPFAMEHTAGSQPGSFWLKNGIDFSWLKLTNKMEHRTPAHALVQSKVQYRPIICLFESDNWTNEVSFMFPSQAFVVVTAHQSPMFIAIKKQLIEERGKMGGARKRKVVEEDSKTVEPKPKKNKKTNRKEIDAASEEDLENLLMQEMDKLDQQQDQPKGCVQEIADATEEDLDDMVMHAMVELEQPVEQFAEVEDRTEEEEDAAMFADFFVTTARTGQEQLGDVVQVNGGGSDGSPNTSTSSSGMNQFPKGNRRFNNTGRSQHSSELLQGIGLHNLFLMRMEDKEMGRAQGQANFIDYQKVLIILTF